MFARRSTKGRVHYNAFNEQNCHVTNIYTAEETQKYQITSRSSKLSRKRFFFCGLCYDEIETAMNKLSN